MLYVLKQLIELTALGKVEWKKGVFDNFILRLDNCEIVLTHKASDEFHLWLRWHDGDIGSFDKELWGSPTISANSYNYSKLEELYDLASLEFRGIISQLNQLK